MAAGESATIWHPARYQRWPTYRQCASLTRQGGHANTGLRHRWVGTRWADQREVCRIKISPDYSHAATLCFRCRRSSLIVDWGYTIGSRTGECFARDA